MPRLFLILALFAAAGCGEVIDRLAVSVGNYAITESGIEREIRLTALLNGEEPDFSPANKRKAAGRLVEQALIRREMEISRYPAPDLSEIAPMLEQIKKVRFGAEDPYREALQHLGLDEQDLKQHLLWQTTLLRFIEMRFRPGVQVSEDDIREYFDRQIKPGNSQPVSIEDYRDRIEEALTGERADKELDSWLKEARSRNKITYHPEAFK
jgi:hypothetical protein